MSIVRDWYRSYTRWTDRDMLRRGRPASPYVPLMALILLALIFWPSSENGTTFLIVAALIFVPWQAWVIWRAIHVVRVADFVASKKYEARDRYKLSRDYHETEFASARARRLRRARK